MAKTQTKSNKPVQFVNHGPDPYTFRLREKGQRIPEARLVTVPARDPKTGISGKSDAVPRALVEQHAGHEGLAKLFDQGILDLVDA